MNSNPKNDEFFLMLVKQGNLILTKEGTIFNSKTKRFIGAKNSAGYMKLSYWVRGENRIVHMLTHRLIWLWYKGSIPKDKELNHKDLNKANPALSNLEPKTHRGNMKHALKAGVLNTFKTGNKVHLKRKTYGNRFKTGIAK